MSSSNQGVGPLSAPAGGEGPTELPFTRLGHYQVLAQLGHGGMGDVYLGYEESLQRRVALKVLSAEMARDETFLKRFHAEAAAVACLEHPHVVPIYYSGQDGDHPFFAMQYVEGESLAGRLSRRGRLSTEEALTVLEQCLAGLSAAHRAGLVHRDVKPGNILLEEKTGRALVADFGLVKQLAGGGGPTVTGQVLGTVDYIAPEQALGQPVDGRADLYALGVVAYQMLGGRLPFQAETPTGMLFQHAYEPPPPLAEVAPDVPESVRAVVQRLMAKDPARRYQSCDEALADLRRACAGRHVTPVAAPHSPGQVALPGQRHVEGSVTTLLPPSSGGGRRPRRLLPLVAGLGLLLLIGGALSPFLIRWLHEPAHDSAQLPPTAQPTARPSAVVAPAPPPGFTTLFNGKDLGGWKVPEGDGGHWSVKNGVLDCDARSQADGDKNLWSEKSYRDFVLLCEWRFKNEPGYRKKPPAGFPEGGEKKQADGKEETIAADLLDSGIFLRGSRKAQVNLVSGPNLGSGAIYGYLIDPALKADRRFYEPGEKVDRPRGEWNSMQITMIDDRVCVILNGTQVIRNARLPEIPREGPIGLQHNGSINSNTHQWADAPSLIQFRHVYLKELGPALAESAKPNRTFAGHGDWVDCLAFSPDDLLLASGCGGTPVGGGKIEPGKDLTVRLWDMKTGEERKQLVGHTHSVCDVQFRGDGKTVLSGSLDGTLRLWDVETGQERASFPHDKPVVSAALSSDGRQAAASYRFSRAVQVWDLEKEGKAPRTFIVPNVWSPFRPVFTQDGLRVLSGEKEGKLLHIHGENGQDLHTFLGHTAQAVTMDLSPDGRHLLSGGQDLTVRLWDVQAGKELRRLDGHAGSVQRVLFCPDGRRGLSSSLDGTVRLWDVETGQELLRLVSGIKGGVYGLAVTSDGRHVASGGMDGIIRLWELPEPPAAK